ncbi:MAG: SMC family ATPase [Chloroflexi bacterium]|nr:SMC family ATPase [Chloroflexota bacterium]
MIPLRLSVENFKGYHRNVPTLQLEGVHMACLCGPNGAGKSSLLDAMAWALWGEAVHRPQDDLVYFGEPEMRVELEFLAGGGRHRVIRRYVRGRGAHGGTTDLQLQVAMDANGAAFRSMSGSLIRETQAAIDKLVGMRYETFVNSAFLVQGRADEFTTKQPAERKRVLGEILGLGLYDRLQERAKDRERVLERGIREAEGELRAWEEVVRRLPEYQEELPRVRQALSAADQELAEAEAGALTLQRRVEALERQREELEDLRGRVSRGREELGQLEEQAASQRLQIEQWKGLMGREREIEEVYGRWKEVRVQEEQMRRSQVSYAQLRERQGRWEELQAELPRLAAASTTARQREAELEVQEEALRSRQAALQGVVVQRETLEAENRRLKREMAELKKRLDLLAEGENRCPLCRTELGKEGKEHIAAEYAAQGKALAQAYRQNEAALRDLEPQHRELAASITQEEGALARRRRQAHGQLAALAQRLEEAQHAPAEAEALRREMERLGYDPLGHQRAQEELGRLSRVEEEHRRLEEARRWLPETEAGLERTLMLARGRQGELAQNEGRVGMLEQEVAELAAIQVLARSALERGRQLRRQHEELFARRSLLEERIRECQELEARKVERGRGLEASRRDQGLYRQLAEVLGKSGVQALLVEAKLPELEAEANRLLGLMTAHTMHMKLETQRTTQRGEAVETLEIKVHDALSGTRSYETFSGGEAFRINLALRIGLSKLLTRHAGAPLATLFMDEGFGTQDAAGRERVLEVVQAIAQEFQRILVITHMDEVKDAFPVRIEVQKTPQGSTFVLT